MKQKYIFAKSKDDKNLMISEFSEIDTGKFIKMCEETYDIDEIKVAMSVNDNALLNAFRTENLFPPKFLATELIEAIKMMVGSETPESFEVQFSDVDILNDDEEKKALKILDDNDDKISSLLDGDDDLESIDETDEVLDSIVDHGTADIDDDSID